MYSHFLPQTLHAIMCSNLDTLCKETPIIVLSLPTCTVYISMPGEESEQIENTYESPQKMKRLSTIPFAFCHRVGFA